MRPEPHTHVVPVEELRALARAVALDGDLEVLVGAPGSGWFIEAKTGRINVDEADLFRGPADDVRGLACHEAAHAAVTRYLHLVPREILRTPGIASLLNSVEDCRIEEWLAVRFPGTAAWIESYNNRLFPKDGGAIGEQPWFQQYCLGAIHEWWYGEPPAGLHAEPAKTLAITRGARLAYVAAQPPVEADLDLLLASPYVGSRAAGVFDKDDVFAPPDAFEKVVRLVAYDAWRLVWRDIRPAYLDLIARDTAHQARMKEHEARFLSQLGELRNPVPFRGPRRRTGLPQWAGEAHVPPKEADPGAPDGGVAELPPDLRDALQKVLDEPPQTVYEAARRDIAGLADRLFEELDRVLRPDSYPRWVGGHPSGSRIDLRVAMAVDVEPGAYLRLWQKKTLPKKRDPAFLLLLDLSGSMSGERIFHGFRGAVLVAEVLERLGVSFAVYGFQDALIAFKDFADPLDAEAKERIGAMPAEVQGSRPGGHNRPEHNWDGPVLLRAADLLAERPANLRVILVLSDGEPSGPADAEGALHRAVRRVLAAGEVDLIGVGLGPGTEHVAKYYPVHLANVPLAGLPVALGGCVGGLLRG